MWAHRKQYGFTIVELLIVIVVIGILAAITIVAYNGVQNKANDTAVQADLRNFVNSARAKYTTGTITVYPAGNDTDLGGIKFGFNRNAYDGTTGALLYCVNSSGTYMVIHGRSASGNQYYYTSDGVSGTTTDAFNGFAALCSAFTSQTTSTYARYGKTSGVWNSWTSN